MRVLLDGQPTPANDLGTNDGLQYGRFDAPGLEVHSFEFTVGADELVEALSAHFSELVAEMREDDLRDEEPSALSRMGYPSLGNAFDSPAELKEVIDIFLDRTILETFLPFSERSEFIINSTDEIQVSRSEVTIRGRCFRKRT